MAGRLRALSLFLLCKIVEGQLSRIFLDPEPLEAAIINRKTGKAHVTAERRMRTRALQRQPVIRPWNQAPSQTLTLSQR